MTKTLKNAVMIFTLLAAIFLIFFCIELILVNRNTDDDGDSDTLLSQTQENGEDENEQNLTNEDLPYDENGASHDIPAATDDIDIPMPVIGRRFEMPMDGTDLTLVAYPDLDFFDLIEGNYDWLFIYTLGGNASLEISFDFIQPLEGMSGLAERFLDGYLDGGESTVLGEGYIGNSELRGYAVIGQDEDDTTFEAWIHSLTGNPDAGLAVVFVLQFENEAQRAALHTIIDNMEMEYEEMASQ